MGLTEVGKIDDSEDLHQVLIEELKNRGGVIQGSNIRKITCPKCGEPEVFSFVDNPSFVHCQRKNNCDEKKIKRTFTRIIQ